ncbi:MAG TPA: VanZ family protein [Pirellulales bacterium]|nr:VanZ family protein [Pirellulales bacterium]
MAIYGSLVPLAWRPLPLDDAVEQFAGLRWRLSVESRTDWATNVLLFVPIGFCWLGAIADGRPGRRRAAAAAPVVIAGCALLSVAIEFSQTWFPPRVPSPNDIAAETLGAAVGSLLYFASGPAVTRWLSSFSTPGRANGRFEWLLQAYVIGFVNYSLLPFDLTLRPAEIFHKYREAKINFVPFAHIRLDAMGWYALVSDVLLYVPIGLATATAFTSRHAPARSFWGGMIWGLAIACGIELGQLLVVSRYSDATQLVLAAVGIAVGVAVGRRWMNPTDERAAPRWFWPAATIIYCAFLLFFFWSPFHWISDLPLIEARRAVFFEAPFSNLYWGTELNAATQVVRKGLMFGLLGAMLPQVAAAWTNSLSASRWLVAGLLAAVAVFALAIEVGQIWLADSTPSFSDALLYIGGSLTGVWVGKQT